MDTAGPVELAPRVWWVGSLLPGDDFQCHVYLVEQGDQSVLIDPGSALTADEVIRKVDAVVGLANVRWLVCSHCDPDIAWVWPFDRRENRATAWLAAPTKPATAPRPTDAIASPWRTEPISRSSGLACRADVEQ